MTIAQDIATSAYPRPNGAPQTLTELDVQERDLLQHLYGSRHYCGGWNAYGDCLGADGLPLMNVRVWWVIERASDRDARIVDEQVEGTA